MDSASRARSHVHDALLMQHPIPCALNASGGMYYIWHLPDLEYNQNLLNAMLFVVAFG